MASWLQLFLKGAQPWNAARNSAFLDPWPTISNTPIRNHNFASYHLESMYWSNVHFIHCAFPANVFNGINVCNCHFENCQFENCTIIDSHDYTSYRNSYWSNVTFDSTKLLACRLNYTTLSRCTIKRSIWERSHFTESDFRHVSFEDTRITNCNFDNTHLRDCKFDRFCRGSIKGASLHDTDLGEEMSASGCTRVTSNSVQDFLAQFFGENVIIIGPAGSGKTSLFSYLTRGTLPDCYNRTEIAMRSGPQHVRRDGVEFRLAQIIDNAPGEQDQWGESLRNATSVFFLFRAQDFLGMRGSEEQEVHITQINSSLRCLYDARRKESELRRPKTYIIATHFDCCNGFSKDSIKNRILENQIYMRLSGIFTIEKLIVGSLKDEDNAQKLIASIKSL